MTVLERIESLYLWHGRRVGEYLGGEPFTVLDHALQAAQLAEWDDAGEAMIAAAFLHDIGQLLPLPPGADRVDDVHELRAVSFLAESFGADVLEPIRLHVQAKRYLVARDPRYEAGLTPASAHALAVQGGAMTAFEARLFEELPFAADAVQLRLYDDRAKVPGRRTPSLPYYLGLLEAYALRRSTGERVQIAALSIA